MTEKEKALEILNKTKSVEIANYMIDELIYQVEYIDTYLGNLAHMRGYLYKVKKHINEKDNL